MLSTVTIGQIQTKQIPADFSRKKRTILVTCNFHQKFGYCEFPKSGKSWTQISKEGKTSFVLGQEGGRSQS